MRSFDFQSAKGPRKPVPRVLEFLGTSYAEICERASHMEHPTRWQPRLRALCLLEQCFDENSIMLSESVELLLNCC